MATRPRTKRRTKGAARKGRPIVARDRRTGRRISLTIDQASELFVGGLAGCLGIADQLGLSASTGAAIAMALETALPKLSIKGVVKAYHTIGGELPPDLGAKLLAHGARRRR